MKIILLLVPVLLHITAASHSGHSKPKESNGKRNFLADAMHEMEFGRTGQLKRIPHVIRVVMKPESRPRRRHHRGHHHKQFKSISSVLRFAADLKKLTEPGVKNSHTRKTSQLYKTENTLNETLRFLEKINSQLENISRTHKKDNVTEIKAQEANITLRGEEEVMVTDSFPLFTELRSIVEHGKPFDPDITRAAFARAKQIVWDSVGQDPSSTDVGHLNNTKLTNAVALLEMAVREAEKMQRNKTKAVGQGADIVNNTVTTASSQANVKVKESKTDALQLKILKALLLEEFKQANYTTDKAGILISDIPFQKLRGQKEATSLMQRLSSPGNKTSSNSKLSSQNPSSVSQTQALLENYTSFITNILKAAHLSVAKNLTTDLSTDLGSFQIQNNSTNANLDANKQSRLNQQEPTEPPRSGEKIQKNKPQSQQEEQRLLFASATQQQQQQQQKQPQQQQKQQHTQQTKVPAQANETVQQNNPQKQEEKPKFLFSNAAQEQHQLLQKPFLSKERLEARKAFGTAKKMVKALLARQELYKAEKVFFAKIHEMLNKTANKAATAGLGSDDKESKITTLPTVASPIQSPVSNQDVPSIGDERSQKQTPETQKKFEEAAHIEEKVAAQQDQMYEALMGHSVGGNSRNVGAGGFGEEGAIRQQPPEDDAESEPFNNEDYGDYKDSDEEAERKFYHDHRQGEFETQPVESNSFSVRDRISSVGGNHDIASPEQEYHFSGSGQAGAKNDKLSNIAAPSWYESSGEDSGDITTEDSSWKASKHKHNGVIVGAPLHSIAKANTRSEAREETPKESVGRKAKRRGETKDGNFAPAVKKTKYVNVSADRKAEVPALDVRVL